MATIYVLEPNARVEKEYGRILVTCEDEVLLRVALQNVSAVVIVGTGGVTTQALHALLQRSVPLFLVNRAGALIGRLCPPTAFNLPLRQAQYRRNDDANFVSRLAQQIVAAKIHNQATLSRRLARRSPRPMTEALAQLDAAEAGARACQHLASLLGIEGSAAEAYFDVYQNVFDPAWGFTKRVRRPPRDAINALLSLGYTFLSHSMTAALEVVGLDPYLGYLHQEAYGRPALALDLIEGFRAPVVDSLVLELINKRLLQPDDFEAGRGGGIYLTRPAMRIFVREFSDKLESTVTWRQIGRPLSYRKLFEVQARSLANMILEKEEFTPFESR